MYSRAWLRTNHPTRLAATMRRIAALRLNANAVPNPASTANPMTAGSAYRLTKAPVATFARITVATGMTTKPMATANSCRRSESAPLRSAAGSLLPSSMERTPPAIENERRRDDGGRQQIAVEIRDVDPLRW